MQDSISLKSPDSWDLGDFSVEKEHGKTDLPYLDKVGHSTQQYPQFGHRPIIIAWVRHRPIIIPVVSITTAEVTSRGSRCHPSYPSYLFIASAAMSRSCLAGFFSFCLSRGAYLFKYIKLHIQQVSTRKLGDIYISWTIPYLKPNLLISVTCFRLVFDSIYRRLKFVLCKWNALVLIIMKNKKHSCEHAKELDHL